MMYVLLDNGAPEEGKGRVVSAGVVEAGKLVRAELDCCCVGAVACVGGPPKMDGVGAWPGVEGCDAITWGRARVRAAARSGHISEG